MPLTPLPALLVEPIVRQALIEDLGRAGDITTDAIAPSDRIAAAVMASRQEGVVAGLDRGGARLPPHGPGDRIHRCRV